MEFIPTIRGGRKLLFEGYSYIKQKTIAGDREVWECELRRRRDCKAKLHLLGEVVVDRVNVHTHAGDAARNEMLTVRANMRTRAEQTEETPQQIITEGTRNMTDAASGRMVAVANVRRNIRRNRQNVANPLPVPGNAAEIVLPQEFQVTTRGGQFLRYDNGEGNAERILLFASNEGLECLMGSRYWFADGTFSTIPQVFFQLYTLHALSVGTGRVFPCIFALVTNKRQETYENVMREVVAITGNRLQPDEALIDFERGAMNALINVFPGIEVKGCFYHLSQSVYRQVRVLLNISPIYSPKTKTNTQLGASWSPQNK